MATVVPAFKGYREAIGKSAEVPYIVFGAADEAEVRAACALAIPDNFPEPDSTPTGTGTDTNLGVPGTCERTEIEITDQINETTWLVTARYERPAWDSMLSPDGRFSFNTSGGTQTINASIATVGYGAGADPAIGNHLDDEGGSAEIDVPVYEWQETHWFYPFQVTGAYKRLVYALTGRVNNASFRGLPAGEVLFRGANGARQGDDPSDKFEISYNFAASPNLTNVTIAGITVASKKGWDLMKLKREKTTITTPKKIVERITAIYVSQVRYPGDFSALGIGTQEVDEQ